MLNYIFLIIIAFILYIFFIIINATILQKMPIFGSSYTEMYKELKEHFKLTENETNYLINNHSLREKYLNKMYKDLMDEYTKNKQKKD